jgi:hypothetical protein
MKWYIRSEDGFRVVKKKKKREKRSECILLLFLTSVG